MSGKVSKNIFDLKVKEYEDWFDRYKWVYVTELELLSRLLPSGMVGLEVGVGTGRFAGKLGIKVGLDVSAEMLKLAQKRGIKTVLGDAHSLPFQQGTFDYVLLMVTICFVKDPAQVLREIHRVLKDNGLVVIGFIDRETNLGNIYLKKKQNSPFYRYATFFSTDEVIDLLKKAGFRLEEILQTLFTEDLSSLKGPDVIKEGYGQGGFVGIRAKKLAFT